MKSRDWQKVRKGATTMDEFIAELPNMMKETYQKAYRQGMRTAADRLRYLIESQIGGNGSINDGLDIAIRIIDEYIRTDLQWSNTSDKS